MADSATAPVGTSKHIHDEKYKRSLIGRPLVPYYGTSTESTDVIDSVPGLNADVSSIVARKWNPDGYFESEERLFATSSGNLPSGTPKPTATHKKRVKNTAPPEVAEVSGRRAHSASAHPPVESVSKPAISGKRTNGRKGPGAARREQLPPGGGAVAWSFHSGPAPDELPAPDAPSGSFGGTRRSRRATSVGASSSIADDSVSVHSGTGWVRFGDAASVDTERSHRSGPRHVTKPPISHPSACTGISVPVAHIFAAHQHAHRGAIAAPQTPSAPGIHPTVHALFQSAGKGSPAPVAPQSVSVSVNQLFALAKSKENSTSEAPALSTHSPAAKLVEMPANVVSAEPVHESAHEGAHADTAASTPSKVSSRAARPLFAPSQVYRKPPGTKT